MSAKQRTKLYRSQYIEFTPIAFLFVYRFWFIIVLFLFALECGALRVSLLQLSEWFLFISILL